VKKLASIIIIFNIFFAFPQGSSTVTNSYPTNYFSKPIEIPLILSGTFGELRSNHFHAGIDIKTQQKEGFNVLAAANGYVSRIKISHWGYGKAIYITHPNGYTTVYAHLQKFNDQIETYLKKQQYKKKNFEIELFPSENTLTVTKSETIAFSGSTGGYAGPHLHFEIRNSKQEILNPMLFGFKFEDSKKPRINSLMGYSLSENSHINGVEIPTKLTYRKLTNGDYMANKITALGTIGFGVNVYDQLDNAYNKNGIYSLEMFVNGKLTHKFIANTSSFSEGKYINLLIDYERKATLNQTIHKTYTAPLNKLNMYPVSINNGYITIKDGLNYTVDIIAKDYKGNSQKIVIPVLGKRESNIVVAPKNSTPYKIVHTEFQKFNKEGVSVAFPKNTFYNNFYLDFDVNEEIVKVHTPIIPLDKRYTLTFDVSKYAEAEKEKLYIASIGKEGNSSYQSTVKKETTFYTSTKTLGNFTLLPDTIPPKVRAHSFANKQWLTYVDKLQVKISDKESGINSYRGEIDGEWILMEYNVKTGLLTYNLNDKKFLEAKHELKVVVKDNVGNESTLNATFFRKK